LAMASLSLRGFFSSRRLNDTTEQILIMTRYARIQSVFQSRCYHVNVDLNERRCWVSARSESQYEPLKNNFGGDLLIPADIKVTFENVRSENDVYYFEFNSEGYTQPGIIRLEDNRENIMEVVCYGPAEYFEMVEIVNGKEQYK
jgi:hypothetical protein